MELRHLKYFQAIARFRSFRQAAVALNVSQSTLSRQIQDLEESLQAKVFDRKSDGIHLTNSGKLLRDRADEIFADVSRLTRDIRSTEEGEVEHIRVGLVGSVSAELLIQATRDLRKKHPHWIVEPHEHNPTEQVAMLQSGHLDLGLVGLKMPFLPPKFKFEHVH